MGMYDAAMKRVGTGLFLKLDAGEKRIRILDHPYVSNKPGYNPGDPIRTVFTWVIWNYEESRLQALEQGKNLFNQIGAIAKSWGEDKMPMDCDLIITTTGAGLETKRTVVPVPHSGTMPPLATLKKQNDGKDWPDLDRLTQGVPLARFSAGENPIDPTELPTNVPADQLPPKSDDVVITDLDAKKDINLDDILF